MGKFCMKGEILTLGVKGQMLTLKVRSQAKVRLTPVRYWSNLDLKGSKVKLGVKGQKVLEQFRPQKVKGQIRG